MGKHIPIDDLFREKLSRGEEQLNLGAWANMERMLDGKNPYAKEEKSKRRILPFILVFTLLSGMLTAGYLSLKQRGTNKHSAETAYAQASPENTQVNQLTASATTGEQSPSNTPAENETTGLSEAGSSVTNSSQMSSSARKNANASAPEQAQATLPKARANSSKNNSSKKSNNATQSTDYQGGDNESNDSNTNSPLTSDAKHSTHGKTKVSNEKATEQTPATTVSAETASVGKAGKKENLNQFKIRENIRINRDGKVRVDFDTLSETLLTREKEERTETPALPVEVSNPRYVELSPEQELAMKQNQPVMAFQSQAPAPQAKTAESIPVVQTPALSTRKHKPEQDGFFEKLRSFAAVSYQKMSLASTALIQMGYPMIPGISIGVNAALFNPQNNFGGFHIGFTNLKPVSGTFSILTELKYFIRNNSGYTVNDIYSQNKNFSTDPVTLANQNKTIYSYQTDSTVNIYNFKNFSSLEMPVMLQAHVRSLSFYGGVNLAYNFKLNVNEIKRNYVLNREVTLDNSETFVPQAELGRQFSRDDFASRFGIGYTIGTSFSFNPNLYVDLRMTKNAWDNAQTLSARQVTAGYFRVPTIQLSLGYRFKKFIPNN